MRAPMIGPLVCKSLSRGSTKYLHYCSQRSTDTGNTVINLRYVEAKPPPRTHSLSTSVRADKLKVASPSAPPSLPPCIPLPLPPPRRKRLLHEQIHRLGQGSVIQGVRPRCGVSNRQVRLKTCSGNKQKALKTSTSKVIPTFPPLPPSAPPSTHRH